MKRFVLDTSSILEYPETLDFAPPGTQYIIPSGVIAELAAYDRNPASGSAYLPLVDHAVEGGFAVVREPPIHHFSPAGELDRRISISDLDVIRIAALGGEEGDEIEILTADNALRKSALAQGLKASKPLKRSPMTGAVGVTAGSPPKTPSDNVRERQRRHLVVAFLLGVGTAIALLVAWNNRDYLASTIGVWGSLLGLVVVALALYWLRGRFRVAYGIAECIVGVYASFLALSAAGITDTTLEGQMVVGLSNSLALQLVGGLYVTVRGLSNVGVGLKGSPLGRRWEYLFGPI